MRSLTAIVLTILVVSVSACTGDNPIRPLVREFVPVAGVPIDLTVNTRGSIPSTGADVTLTVIVSVQPGTSAGGVPVDVTIRSHESGQQRTDRFATFAEGIVMPVYRLTETTTFTVNVGTMTRTATVTRTE